MLKTCSLLILMSATNACTAQTELYDIEKIKIHNVVSSSKGEIFVIYSAIMETMYYSPGAIIKKSNNDYYISFVRASINDKKTAVQYPAMSLDVFLAKTKEFGIDNIDIDKKDALGAIEIIKLDANLHDNIYFVDKINQKKIWPR